MTNKFSIETKKVELLENVVKAMCRKVLCLEGEVEHMKNTNITGEDAGESSMSEVSEETENETENVKINNIGLINNSSDDIYGSKVLNSSPKKKEEIVDKSKDKDLLYCEQCRYKCKQDKYLKKHMITKHSEHQCKECAEKFPTFIELLKHVSNQHFEEQGEVQEEYKEINEQSALKEEEEIVKRSIFVFGDSKQI